MARSSPADAGTVGESGALTQAQRPNREAREKHLALAGFLSFYRLRFRLLLLPFALRFALPLALRFALPFTGRTPEVFSFPLLFVTTPVLAGTLLRLALAGTLAFVSTAPVRAGLPAAFALFEFAVPLALS